jgi:hypothetical protein
MKRLRKFFRLPAARRRCLISAVLLLPTIKASLVVFRFQTLRGLLARLTGLPLVVRRSEGGSTEEVVWAVESASKLMPWASTCLTQALTAQVLLLRRGRPALVHIGTVRGEDGDFKAHAWVESRGEVLIGGHELEQYSLLAVLEGERS